MSIVSKSLADIKGGPTDYKNTKNHPYTPKAF